MLQEALGKVFRGSSAAMNRWVPMGALEADATAAAAAPASEAVSPEPPPMSRSRLTSTYFRQLSIRNTHQVAVLCIIQYYVLIRINKYYVLPISARPSRASPRA